ncbi:hypothetical protein M0D69_24935 [Caballeronia sp. SEWSISQ10-4 2]|uniref:hypothetical protein n=1 Tax=Caballeronia sp. SEWSISQ10-4 2 TaxID=2937438 RepID=UPI0026536062|nr:hypothetical protein [Caballeronia sp. SEWSISQ10-4 2]MDN7181180.1 hypothetical protein [Caballeronia sp. SEWSISQ10-4 2]
MAVNYVGDDNCAGRAAENFTALAIRKSNAGLAKDRKISSKATLGCSVNRSDCTASAGRALPKSPWIATATMLPPLSQVVEIGDLFDEVEQIPFSVTFADHA